LIPTDESNPSPFMDVPTVVERKTSQIAQVVPAFQEDFFGKRPWWNQTALRPVGGIGCE